MSFTKKLVIGVAALAVCALAIGPVQGQPPGMWYKPGFIGPNPFYLGAPSGMPDIDQHQNFDGNMDVTINPQEAANGDDLYYCAPTAAANCLWWFGSVAANAPSSYAGNLYGTRYPALADVDLDGTIDRTPNVGAPDGAMALVQNLANLMDTNDQRNLDTSPNMGTWVPANVFPWGTGDGFGPIGGYGLEPGIREYIDIRNTLSGSWKYPLSVPLEVRSIALPNFQHFRTELLSCNNIILTLADPDHPMYEPEPVPGDQTGFHCVTAAGVTSPGVPPGLAISDPWTDNAEAGGAGRVLTAAHPPAPHPANVHNDPQMVSHDVYGVNIVPHPTMGWAGAQSFNVVNYMNSDEDHQAVWMTIVYPTAHAPVSFSVAPNAQGIVPPQSPTNDVFNLNSGGLPNEGEILGSTTRRDQLPLAAPAGSPAPGMTAGNNQTDIGSGTLGLAGNDNVDSLSYGMDSGEIVYFSVDPDAKGMTNTAVFNESTLSNPNFALNIGNPQNPGGGGPGAEAAGDIFKAMAEENQSFGRYYRSMHFDEANLSVDPCWICDEENDSHPANKIFIDDAQIGLQAPGADPPVVQPPVMEDDLDAFEYADATDPVWGVDPDGDGIPDEPVFFTLAPGNPSGYNPGDILVFDPSVNTVTTYADGMLDMGLDRQDDIDALALADVEVDYSGPNPTVVANPDGMVDMDFDEALFSLAPGSPTLGLFAYSPGDIFYTDFDGSFSLWTPGNQIGLEFYDNLNALDVMPCVPEPGTLLLTLLGLASIGLFHTRRRRT